ncbi:MAG: hypothetical protein ACRENP_21250 [Longimicrobiales bacterium]
MSIARTRKTVLVLIAVSALASCRDDRVSGPPEPELPATVSYLLPSAERLRLVRRASSALRETSVTRRIDGRGGVLAVDGAVLMVPAGALSAPVDITLTVPEGGDIRADFQPHGLRFRKPALLAFSVAGSSYDAARAADELIGAYFLGEPNDGVITTREVNPVFQYGRMAAFQIWHFCSYGVAPKKGLILVGG